MSKAGLRFISLLSLLHQKGIIKSEDFKRLQNADSVSDMLISKGYFDHEDLVLEDDAISRMIRAYAHNAERPSPDCKTGSWVSILNSIDDAVRKKIS